MHGFDTLLWKNKKKIPQKFWETTMAFKKKMLEKKMNGFATWDRFTLRTTWDESWFIKPKIKKKKNPKFLQKI